MKHIHIGRTLYTIVRFFVGLIPKNRNLILFSSWFGKKYCDNSMFQFEYLRGNGDFSVYWYTKNKDLYQSLKSKDIPSIYSKSLRGVWMQIRAIMLVSTIQFDDFNRMFLKKCIYLDLNHGAPGKPGGVKLPNGNSWFDFCKKDVSMYIIAASKFGADLVTSYFNTDFSHCIFCNQPRIDVLFDPSLQEGKNLQVAELKKEKRIISYLPTHRHSGKKIMDMSEILDLRSIQYFCEKNNSVFLIKKHFYHKNEVEDFGKYPNIIDITHDDIDTQVLLAQTDILVTDFSSCFVDYLPTDRPIIYYAYDYDEYMANERDYYWKYDKIHAGFTTKTFGQFMIALNSVCTDWKDEIHRDGRKEMREVYFDPEVEMGTTRKKLMGIMEQLIEGTYVPYDWSKKR